MRSKISRPSGYAERFSRDVFPSRNTLSHNPHSEMNNASDEEFILQDVGTVRKTTDINVTYEEARGKITKGMVPGIEDVGRYDKLG